jgi:hypothetical protein
LERQDKQVVRSKISITQIFIIHQIELNGKIG